MIVHLKLLFLQVVTLLSCVALGKVRLELVGSSNCLYRLLVSFPTASTSFTGLPLSVFRNGEWDQDVECTSVHAIHGFDDKLQAAFSGWEVVTNKDVRLSLKNFEEGRYATFTFTFMKDVSTTASTKPTSAAAPLLATSFPSFGAADNVSSTLLDGRLAWQGNFIQAQFDECSTGTQGGPCILYNSKNPTSSGAIVFSTLDNFLTTSRSVKVQKQSVVWAGSTSGKIKRIPKGYSHSFIVLGGVGISDTMFQWGQVLQRYYKTTRVADVTIDTLGYQTDNGAQYCFGCGNNCDEVLLTELAYLKGIGVPVRYLSYQNAWWHTSGTAPWCVSDWDWVPSKVKNIPEFHRKAGIPFQLYAPYFCNETKYASNFTFLTSNPSLPTCDGFLFKDIAPEESLEFYDWFFRLGISYGMASYEADFVNQNLNCVDRFLEEIGAAETFLDGMTTAAQNLGLSVQWCYSPPSALLQSLRYPVVTNFRGSFDYYYGGSWDIGMSSILMWALQASPSTDTFWTSDNGDVATTLGACDKKKGCPADHSDSGCELHTMLAILSTGPVGFSDAINQTNAKRIRATCRADGVLLKPSKPLTTMDSHMRKPYHLLHTYSRVAGSFDVSAYYVLGHHLDQLPHSSLEVGLKELWPQTLQERKWAVRLRGEDDGCKIPGSLALKGCLHDLTEESFSVNKWNHTFLPRLYTLVPLCPKSNWALLGEVEKFVSVSSARFTEVECLADSSLKFGVKGKPGETVEVSLVGPNGHGDLVVFVKKVVIPSAVTSRSRVFSELDLDETSLVETPEANIVQVIVH